MDHVHTGKQTTRQNHTEATSYEQPRCGCFGPNLSVIAVFRTAQINHAKGGEGMTTFDDYVGMHTECEAVALWLSII